MKKHEGKHIASDTKQLQRWTRAYADRTISYSRMGFDEAARRASIAATALLLARESMERGVPSERVEAELHSLLSSTRRDRS